MASPRERSSLAGKVQRAMEKHIGPALREALRSLEGVFVVGGVIRDSILGRPIVDLDVVALPEARAKCEAILARHSRGFVRINDRFSTVRYFTRRGTCVDFSVAEKGIEADLLRRDYALNAIAMEVATGTLIDPAGGLRDLRARRIAVVRPENLSEDPLRVLRAYRLASECDASITPETRDAIRAAAPLLPRVAPERIYEELRRLGRLQSASEIVHQMHADGALVVIFPEMRPMETTPASPIYDASVMEHTLAALTALDGILRDPSAEFGRFGPQILRFLAADEWPFILRVAVLLHDIAKPATVRKVRGSLHYYGHDTAGAKMAEEILKRLRFPNRDIDRVVTLIRGHLRPGFLSAEQTLTPRQIYRYYREFGDLGVALLVHARADLLGYGPEAKDQPYGRNQPAITEELLSAYFVRNQILVRPPRYLTGDDLKALGIPPGPIYTTLLEAAREATALGNIQSREQALKWARAFRESLRHQEPPQ